MPTFIQATPAHRDLLTTMRASLYAHEGTTPTPESAHALDTLLASPNLGSAYLIADQNAPVGYLVLIYSFSIEHAGPTALLDELYIAEPARGKGLGKAALQFTLETARKSNCKIIYLEVSKENPTAQEFYRRRGFEPLRRDYLALKLL